MGNSTVLVNNLFASRARVQIKNNLNYPVVDMDALDEVIFECIIELKYGSIHDIIKILFDRELIKDDHLSLRSSADFVLGELTQYIESLLVISRSIDRELHIYLRHHQGWWVFERRC